MKKIEAKVNNQQYQEIIKYCEENEISIYQLVKEAVLDKVGYEDIGKVGFFNSVIKSVKDKKKE